MNFNFKKKYGQNFLTQKEICKKIATTIQNREDALVIEVGCGDGRLTSELCKNYPFVLGYEIDTDVMPLLLNNLIKFHNCKIICNDFLAMNIKEDMKEYHYEKLYFVGNLPYYITTPIIEKIIKSDLDIDEMVFMVQKEVGDRFSAKPNSKDYGSLSVFLNYYFDIKKEFDVNRNNFVPKPNVDSVVVSFKKKEKEFELKDKKVFFALVRDSFRFKRKTIKNNLDGYDLEKVLEVLKKYNYDLTVRAEQLKIEIFVEIANNLS